LAGSNQWGLTLLVCLYHRHVLLYPQGSFVFSFVFWGPVIRIRHVTTVCPAKCHDAAASHILHTLHVGRGEGTDATTLRTLLRSLLGGLWLLGHTLLNLLGNLVTSQPHNFLLTLLRNSRRLTLLLGHSHLYLTGSGFLLGLNLLQRKQVNQLLTLPILLHQLLRLPTERVYFILEGAINTVCHGGTFTY
jgi:hypothetical protein